MKSLAFQTFGTLFSKTAYRFLISLAAFSHCCMALTEYAQTVCRVTSLTTTALLALCWMHRLIAFFTTITTTKPHIAQWMHVRCVVATAIMCTGIVVTCEPSCIHTTAAVSMDTAAELWRAAATGISTKRWFYFSVNVTSRSSLCFQLVTYRIATIALIILQLNVDWCFACECVACICSLLSGRASFVASWLLRTLLGFFSISLTVKIWLNHLAWCSLILDLSGEPNGSVKRLQINGASNDKILN